MIKFVCFCKFSAILCVLGVTVNSTQAFECKVNASLSGSFRDQWNNVPPGRPPFLPLVRDVVKKQNFYVYVLFCKFAVKDGRTAISFDLQVVTPAGKIYLEQKQLNGLPDNLKNAESKSVFMSQSSFKICFENNDSPGKYIVKIIARDNLGNCSAVSECAVNLVAAPEKHELLDFSAKANQDIMTFYYSKPQPQKLIPLFMGFCKAEPEIQKKNRNYSPMNILMFFYKTFDANQYLLPELAEQAKTLDKQGKKHAVYILHYLNKNDKNLLEVIGSDAVSFAETLDRHPNPFVIDNIINPVQEDMLWLSFFATGEFAPIKMLVDAMNNMKNGISAKQYKDIPVKTPDDRKKLMLGAIGGAAMWSLSINAKTHPLVFYYCETLFQRNKTDKFINECLGKILNRASKSVLSQSQNTQ